MHRDNITLRLNYYANMKDSHLYDLLRQAIINTKNQLMDFSDSSWQDCPDTGRSTRSYIILYQDGPLDHGTHVPVPEHLYRRGDRINDILRKKSYV